MTDVWSEHGLSAAEYDAIRTALGREPNRVELGIAGAMWSEHCSYKSSRRWLAELPTTGEQVVQGPGENAGIVRLHGPWCLAFKVESHNHPSYIEPYHGAATGVGGILRDVFTMGARPIANLNAIRFGEPGHPKTPFLLDGVVRGIGDYGNCMGVPTVAGETTFGACYNGNILVNAMTVGLVREDAIFYGTAAGAGNPVFYLGSATGMDGIHGATMSSASFSDDVEDQRPAVQVGDPFTEKLLLEACLELMAAGCVVGIQDMGAAGLTSSSFEMASRSGAGMDLDLEQVPVRQPGLGPYELMLSESQERMLVVLEKGQEDVAREIFAKWDLHVAEIGRVTDTPAVRCYWHGDLVAELPVDLMVDAAPKLDRPYAADPEREARWARAAAPLAMDPADALAELLAHPVMADKTWITDQYDGTVQGNTVRSTGADAGVVWVPEAQTAVAVCIEGNSRLVHLDPYTGAQHVVAEGVRNLACVGAEPLGATDCLNFGNPERETAYGEFVGAVEGLRDGLNAAGVPIVSGNVSFYNETNESGVWPTPTVGFVGRVLPDLDRLPAGNWDREGLPVLRLGTPPETLAGTAYLDLLDGRVEGRLPAPDFHALARLQRLLAEAMEHGWLVAAHDVAEGGLLVALAEMCFAADVGLRGTNAIGDPAHLFGEAAQQVVVATADVTARDGLARAAAALDVPVLELGTTGGDRLQLPDAIDRPLAELKAPWSAAIPALVREDPHGLR